MKNLLIVLALFLGHSVLAQAASRNQIQAIVPASQHINTTQPPNLSWIVGEFRVIKMANGIARLEPIKQALMPQIVEVRYSWQCKAQYKAFKADQTLILVIREGWVSQVFTK